MQVGENGMIFKMNPTGGGNESSQKSEGGSAVIWTTWGTKGLKVHRSG